MARTTYVDMSPSAVTRRLKETSDLLKLAHYLMKAKYIGPVERPKIAEAADRKLRRDNKKWREAQKKNSDPLVTSTLDPSSTLVSDRKNTKSPRHQH